MHVLNTDTRSGTPGPGRPIYLFNDWRSHGQQVADVARDIALELGLSDGSAARIEKAARYHDIGKSRLPDIFDDAEEYPETLSRPERELLMSHTWLGYRIVQSGRDPDSWVADAALLHHEWWNGSGYPLGLAQSDIPLVARIVAVANSYSTLLQQRPHASAWHIESTLAQIRSGSGSQFDPECVKALAAVASRQEPLVSHASFAASTIAV